MLKLSHTIIHILAQKYPRTEFFICVKDIHYCDPIQISTYRVFLLCNRVPQRKNIHSFTTMNLLVDTRWVPLKVMPNTVMTRLSTALNWLHDYSLNSSILKTYCDGKENSQSFQVKNPSAMNSLKYELRCRSWTVNGSLNWALKEIVWWKIWINYPHSSYFSLF